MGFTFHRGSASSVVRRGQSRAIIKDDNTKQTNQPNIHPASTQLKSSNRKAADTQYQLLSFLCFSFSPFGLSPAQIRLLYYIAVDITPNHSSLNTPKSMPNKQTAVKLTTLWLSCS